MNEEQNNAGERGHERLDGQSLRWGGGHPRGFSGRLRLPPVEREDDDDREDVADVGDAAGASERRVVRRSERLTDQVASWLSDHAAELHLSDGEDVHCNECVDLGDGTTVLRFDSTVGGVPVWGGEHVVVVEDDAITSVQLDDGGRLPGARADTREAALSATDARRVAHKSVGEPPLRMAPPQPSEVMFRRDGRLILTWRVLLASAEPADWEVFVDAATGEVLQTTDLIVDVEGTGAVFDPNPVVTANDPSLRAPDALGTCGFTPSTITTVDGERVTRTLRDLDIVDGKAVLDGPYCRIVNLAEPDDLPPSQPTPYTFEFSSADPQFDAVNVYFHVDSIQRYLRDELGINAAHPHRIDADVADGTKRGAFYSTIDKALHFGDSGDCGPNRAADGDVVAHEYGHAIQLDQVPNWGITAPTTGRKEARAMGEGFGDILACLLFAERGGGFQREVFEDWAFSQNGGLRRVDGTRRYQEDWLTGLGEHHENGQIWSGALWQIYLRLGGSATTQAKRESAANEVLGSLIRSHHRLTASATMAEGAEALMLQNCSIRAHRGVGARHMLDAFHERGILQCMPGSDVKIVELWSQQDDASVRGWEQVEAGQDNFFYARLRNGGPGIARAATVSFAFKSPFLIPVFPTDFRDDSIASACAFDLVPGAEVVVSARWPSELIPAVPTGSTRRHGCILAEVYSPCDHVGAATASTSQSGGKLKQRNTDIVDVVPDQVMDYSIHLDSVGFAESKQLRFIVDRDPRFTTSAIELRHRDRVELERLVGVPEIEIEEVRRPGGMYLLDPVRVAIEPESPNELPVVLRLPEGSGLLRGTAALLARRGPLVHRNGGLPGLGDVVEDETGASVRLAAGRTVSFTHQTRVGETGRVGLRLRVPATAQVGDRITTVVRQTGDDGETFGEFDLIMRVVAPGNSEDS
ncbi:MAG: hypothetical protein GY708_30175 [Actinomycetia bacterium]|nr:hypothetical protein [Actinomycetes bacterium]